MPNDDNEAKPAKSKVDSDQIYLEEIVIRPESGTKEEVKIVISQRISNGKYALASAVWIGKVETYFESPQYLLDRAAAEIYAAVIMKKLNKKVKNGS